MPLAMVSIGEKRKIKSLTGTEDIKKHLIDLGFVSGQDVLVLGDSAAGMILLVKGTKLALNRGLAQKILVA
ncbi:MAG: ferrous iron transport protein A [Candidatus Treponema excrementipullorum]|uniref:Ferrous iron transport protein A n=1 Tax=Candidatus Treponema excrementipullorum TaxID=2838768 RepID=A0A9E2L362_9SPIR|nr:ferrous iron transport protein A [Candidatus Treponema excrementipullorum]MCI6478852.1 ferrous iron transport protein A [Spirochaetia bacterium]MCI6954313.1 ferrous iron transport protein A [Spirochaetia bacterium]MCI7590158.1 ferrous iron transport protein A [Spirochaetia bacterium]MDD7011648.1 ferrous iron transport protein A [Candidatus Treponema excrementipullorum]